MDISVIIPVFNRLEFVKKAIASVLNQTYSPKEIIIINDGSSENIEDGLKTYSQIKLISYSKNYGVAYARNMGIKESNNNWLAFLDSDDIWHEDKLKEQVNFHHQNQDIKISQTNEIWIRNNNQIIKPKWTKKPSGDIFLNSLDKCHITPSSVIIHKSIFNDIGLFDENLEVCEDYDLWLRISRKYNIGLLDKELITKYGGHKDQLSTKYWGMDRFRIKALEKCIQDPIYGNIIKEKIISKYNILLNGAKKRNRLENIEEYTKALCRLQI